MSELQSIPEPLRGASGVRGEESPREPAAAPKIRCSATAVKKAFGEQPILRGVDLQIAEGAFAVLVGPSGCGKSTLLRLIAGLEQPDEGTIELAGRDVTRLPPRDRDVAMVFQSYALYPHLTVRDNLAFGLRLRGAAPAEIDARIREASAMLSLDNLLARFPKQLSGGQRQRVAMGRAIVRRPTLFLFDEPLSNLDAALRAEVRVEIRRLHDRLKATTLYVTHDQVEAMTLADTLWVMNGGHVEQSGKPLEIYERPRTKFVAGFLGSPQINFLDGMLKERGGGLVAEGSGLAVPVDEARFGRTLAPGRAVSIGIRPHDFAVAEGGSGDVVATLRVELVEALGFEAFAHGWLTASGPRVVVRLDAAEVKGRRGATEIPLRVDRGHVHLFDAATGVALAST
jgi:sn-glycerol 3-phosphate transport system ATP-binding protein/multiple sugar transport system ATP-binding protein